jgi:hypothetical protein
MVPPLPDAPKGERAYTPCDPSITENALELGLDRLRADIESAAAEVEPGLVRRLLHLVDREQSARSGWRFVMIEPRLYSDVMLPKSWLLSRPWPRLATRAASTARPC